METHICEEVFAPNTDHAYLCGRFARYCVDGKWYCGYHYPNNYGKLRGVKAKEKRAKEQLAIECHDDLVAALEHAILRDHPYSPQSCAGCNAACAALARARGEK